MILYKEDLDKVQCSEPSCDHTGHDYGGLFLQQKCHPYANQTVLYEDGKIKVFCSECDRDIAEVAVAKAPFVI